MDFSRLMGLLENMSKLNLVAADGPKKKLLYKAAEKRGYEKYVKDSAEVLGAIVSMQQVRPLTKRSMRD